MNEVIGVSIAARLIEISIAPIRTPAPTNDLRIEIFGVRRDG
jgi:hypothetical protein